MTISTTKTPLPMVPVPQAIETVLTETAKLLWIWHHSDPNRQQKSLAVTQTSSQLLGMLSDEEIKAPLPGYPNHNSAVMDGFAIKTSDLISAREARKLESDFSLDFVIVGKVYAGDDGMTILTQPNGHRSAVYVTTGAVIPAGYDAVIPIEETALIESLDHTQKIRIIPSKLDSVLKTEPWTWIRTIGSDIPADSIVISRGEKIMPVHLALLTQIGLSLASVKVKRRIRVGVLSTGNELYCDEEANMSSIGKIPDVNRPLLLAQLLSYENCEPVDLGVVTDDEGTDSIANRLNDLLCCEGNDSQDLLKTPIDVLITTGGISMGEKDIMDQVFLQGMGGTIHFGRMNMKPGKPTTFITIDRNTIQGNQVKKLIFGLPGNPVSASVCTELLIKPCLDLLYHGAETDDVHTTDMDIDLNSFVQRATENAFVHDEIMATLSSDIVLDKGRPEYMRVSLKRKSCIYNDCHNHSYEQFRSHHYFYEASSTGVQRSSRVLSLRNADGLMMLPRGGPDGCGYDIARKGMQYPVLLYSSQSKSALERTCFKNSIHRKMMAKPDQPMIHIEHTHGQLRLGVIFVVPHGKMRHNDDFSTSMRLIQYLGGDSQAVLLHCATCDLSLYANIDAFTRNLTGLIDSSDMIGTNVIFVIVSTDSDGEEGESSDTSFSIGLEISHALRPMLTKQAHAMALQVRAGASSRDSLAALFENVVGTVRRGTALLISCSDRGLEGAVNSISGSLQYLMSTIIK